MKRYRDYKICFNSKNDRDLFLKELERRIESVSNFSFKKEANIQLCYCLRSSPSSGNYYKLIIVPVEDTEQRQYSYALEVSNIMSLEQHRGSLTEEEYDAMLSECEKKFFDPVFDSLKSMSKDIQRGIDIANPRDKHKFMLEYHLDDVVSLLTKHLLEKWAKQSYHKFHPNDLPSWQDFVCEVVRSGDDKYLTPNLLEEWVKANTDIENEYDAIPYRQMFIDEVAILSHYKEYCCKYGKNPQ